MGAINCSDICNLIQNLIAYFQKTNLPTWVHKNDHNSASDQLKLAPLYSAYTELSIYAKNSTFMKKILTVTFPGAGHIYWYEIYLADALSCNNISSFLSYADQRPTPVPQPLLDLLTQADWISPHWSRQFKAIFQNGLVQPTQKGLQCSLECFYTFCLNYVINPFPLAERTLCSFAAFLADQGLSPQTIKSGLQISLGLPDPREQSYWSDYPLLSISSYPRENPVYFSEIIQCRETDLMGHRCFHFLWFLPVGWAAARAFNPSTASLAWVM